MLRTSKNGRFNNLKKFLTKKARNTLVFELPQNSTLDIVTYVCNQLKMPLECTMIS